MTGCSILKSAPPKSMHTCPMDHGKTRAIAPRTRGERRRRGARHRRARPGAPRKYLMDLEFLSCPFSLSSRTPVELVRAIGGLWVGRMGDSRVVHPTIHKRARECSAGSPRQRARAHIHGA